LHGIAGQNAARRSLLSIARRSGRWSTANADKREQVLDLTDENFTHFDNVLAVDNGKIRLKRQPAQLVFVSAKTANPKIAPWLDV
jgi:hypothetical protein